MNDVVHGDPGPRYTKALLVGALVLGNAFVLPAIMGSPIGEAAPAQASAYQASVGATDDRPSDYIIGPLDKLNISVFKVNDLNIQGLQVDASGHIVFPLIGSVTAAGKTTQQLSDEIAHRLGAQYLQNPQVTVVLAESSSERVTVEGEVRSPGVFKMPGRTTLLDAIAMGGGLGETADLHKVAIIRTVGGQRRSIMCDYADIRSAKAADPVIEPGDVVVVDGSRTKSTWNSLLKSMPIIALVAAGA